MAHEEWKGYPFTGAHENWDLKKVFEKKSGFTDFESLVDREDVVKIANRYWESVRVPGADKRVNALMWDMMIHVIVEMLEWDSDNVVVGGFDRCTHDVLVNAMWGIQTLVVGTRFWMCSDIQMPQDEEVNG